jgi:hypothetical protein
VAGLFISFGATYLGGRADAQGDQALHIDIPVKLEKANVVFDIGHLVLNGDMPFFSETWIYSPLTSAAGTSKVKLLPYFTETLPISC